ncbi:MAG TPA: serine protease [Pyrinomonadaceae bacterium]|nr:serine protease [Pyrinomonadaceae bacterium]
MKRRMFWASILTIAALAYVPNCKAGGHRTVKRPGDSAVSLELKFMKKRANPLQRFFSLLDGPNGFATGFLVGDQLVMTAYHAVSGNLSVSKKVQLGFAPDDELEVEVYVQGCQASVIKFDEAADLALLQICQKQKHAVAPAFQASLSKDENLFVIARPHGNRLMRKGVFYGPYELRGQQFSLATIVGRDGYSGSPVYNQQAEIVGVFSGYDPRQKLVVISPGLSAQKLLDDYIATPKP